MSAWMCSDVHLSVLTDAIHMFHIVGPEQTKEDTFAELHLQNELSLEARYGDELSEKHEGYQRSPEVRPEDIYTLARSYVYQSCEHGTAFENSDAAMWIAHLLVVHETRWGGPDRAWRRCRDIEPEGMWAIP